MPENNMYIDVSWDKDICNQYSIYAYRYSNINH